MKNILQLFMIIFLLVSCSPGNNEQDNIATPIGVPKPVVACDTFPVDDPPVKKHSAVLDVWLETTSLDWFLDKRQSAAPAIGCHSSKQAR